MKRIRLYGAGVGHGSWARVTAGLREGFEAHGLLSAVHYHDDPEEQSIGEEPIAVYVGSPRGWPRLRNFGSHRERWVVLAPNSTWVPRGIVESVTKYATGILAPSAWAARELAKHVPPGFPIRVMHHGVSVDFKPYCWPRDSAVDTTFRVLHMTSSDRQRKGTAELLQAWNAFLERHSDSQLTIVADTMSSVGPPSRQDPCAQPSISVLPRVDLAPYRFAEFLSGFDCVCQPSRAEGFGMVPLEALACGVPVVATAVTGHFDYLPCGNGHRVSVVPHGSWAPIDDGPGAMAPAINWEDVLDALNRLYERREEALEDAYRHADATRAAWAWPLVVWRSGFVQHVREVR